MVPEPYLLTANAMRIVAAPWRTSSAVAGDEAVGPVEREACW